MENNFLAFMYRFLLVILKLYTKYNRYKEAIIDEDICNLYLLYAVISNCTRKIVTKCISFIVYSKLCL